MASNSIADKLIGTAPKSQARAERLPSLLLSQDIDDRHWRAEVERIVLDVLRRVDMLQRIVDDGTRD